MTERGINRETTLAALCFRAFDKGSFFPNQTDFIPREHRMIGINPLSSKQLFEGLKIVLWLKYMHILFFYSKVTLNSINVSLSYITALCNS